MDLSEWIESGRWRATLELVEQLPWASRFRAAMLNDPDYADMIAEAQLRQESEGSDDGPSVAEFGSVEQRLTTLIDLMKVQVQWSQRQAGVKSPSKMKPEPRPKTLVSELIERKEQEVGLEVASQFGFDRSDFFMDAS